MSNHLHQLASALRSAADANDMAQVKRYIGQINEFADNLDNQEKARREADDKVRKEREKVEGQESETVRDESPQPRPTKK